MSTEIDIILKELTSDNDHELIAATRKRLEAIINNLINADFEKLVNILYRIDVNEQKLKTLLKENDGKNAASIISNLVIERQIQKIKSRQQFSQGKNDDDINENEKW